MSKYRIAQNIVTEKYKIQQKILWFWVNIFSFVGTTKESAEEFLKGYIKYKEGLKRSSWKEV